MTKVFISYSRTDNTNGNVDDIINLLRKIYGYDNVWFDRILEGGQPWWNEILNRIEWCDVYIYLVSRESIESLYCRAEFSEASRLRKYIVPTEIRSVDSSRYPDVIDLTQIVKLHNINISSQFADLVSAIHNRIADVNPSPLWNWRTNLPKTLTKFQVPAKLEGGINTGILLINGDEAEINTDGRVTWTERPEYYAESDGSPHLISNEDAYRTREGLGILGSLFGWLGNNYEPEKAFLVPKHIIKSITKADGVGFLHLSVNDARGTYEHDNRGEFTVSIRVKRSD